MSVTTAPSSTADCPAAATESAWHIRSIDEAVDQLRTDLKGGLAQTFAEQQLAEHGPNEIAQAEGRSLVSLILAQFQSLIVVLLVAATVIAFAMGDTIEGIAILCVILINAAIGFLTEWKAEQALSALQKQAVRMAQVIRDGVEKELPAADLVPGDLVVLAAGARVPADGRIIESVQLKIEEAALTGESVPATKTSDPLEDAQATVGDRINMAFLGTTITDGRGRMLVTDTGARTEVGKIGLLIGEATSRGTPLEQKLHKLGRLLLVIVLVLCTVIVVAGMLRGSTDFWHMLEIGLSLAIAAVPEGLPAVTTMTLALGMQRMARMRALIRRLPAVETLGSTTVICTDKTGTLTKNEMTANVVVVELRKIDVTGTGYGLEGEFQSGEQALDPIADERLQLALRIGALCNDAKVERSGEEETILGDPTEAALVVLAEKAGMKLRELAAEFPRISEVPFDSTTKRMVTVHRTKSGKPVAYLKGAPGSLLADSNSHVHRDGVQPLTEDVRKNWMDMNDTLGAAALRVLGLAYRDLPDSFDDSHYGRDLIFVGLVGMRDPLRDEAKTAIATCREAGIRTVMITGDQQPTAAEIARQLGIDRNLEGGPLLTVHGKELAGLDDAGWRKVVSEAAVFARVSPEHKLQIVEALQQQGEVVAMTGDGVNDAPALKKADIGIAMGIKGTEVAKENAAMVITDDNFATIVGAVEQGRIIYGNIIRFLHYLLSCNFSEILTVFLALMIGWPLPLGPLQILWLNLITDVFPAFALALEPSAPGAMKRPPRDPNEALITPKFVGLIAWQGLLLAAVSLLAFGTGLHWHGVEEAGLRRAATMAFMTLALTQVFHVFSSRSQHRSAFTARLWTNGWLWAAVVVCVMLQLIAVYLPILQRVLHTVPPTPADWAIIAGCSLLPVAVVESIKLMTSFFFSENARSDNFDASRSGALSPRPRRGGEG